jgi:hypothetical protein
VSLRSDAVVVCSYVHTNAGLCGPLVSMGSVGTNYNCWANNNPYGCDGTQGTNLGTDCPTQTPTGDPAGYVRIPCCDDAQAWRDAHDARLQILRQLWSEL